MQSSDATEILESKRDVLHSITLLMKQRIKDGRNSNPSIYLNMNQAGNQSALLTIMETQFFQALPATACGGLQWVRNHYRIRTAGLNPLIVFVRGQPSPWRFSHTHGYFSWQWGGLLSDRPSVIVDCSFTYVPSICRPLLNHESRLGSDNERQIVGGVVLLVSLRSAPFPAVNHGTVVFTIGLFPYIHRRLRQAGADITSAAAKKKAQPLQTLARENERCGGITAIACILARLQKRL